MKRERHVSGERFSEVSNRERCEQRKESRRNQNASNREDIRPFDTFQLFPAILFQLQKAERERSESDFVDYTRLTVDFELFAAKHAKRQERDKTHPAKCGVRGPDGESPPSRLLHDVPLVISGRARLSAVVCDPLPAARARTFERAHFSWLQMCNAHTIPLPMLAGERGKNELSVSSTNPHSLTMT